MLCSSCPYFKVGVARKVRNSHVIVLCSVPLVSSKSGVLRTVSGTAPMCGWLHAAAAHHIAHFGIVMLKR